MTSKHLEKLNKDLNNTAELGALLKLAVGARVMLRCNGKVEGLVNGTLGTVLAMAATHITIKFDKINKPCEIEKVKRKFLVMKNFCVQKPIPFDSSLCCNNAQESGSLPR